MKNPSVPDLKDLFKQASEIAKQVPENMQETAFNRALDMLTNTQGMGPTARDQIPKDKSPVRRSNPKKTDSIATPVEGLLDSINSTQYPEIILTSKVLDRALMVLRIALNDHGVDGLDRNTISKILTEKFRIKTTANSVNKALAGDTNLVDRTKVGKGYSYKIMAPGMPISPYPAATRTCPAVS